MFYVGIVCVCVCMCMCVSLCVYIHIYIYIYVYIYVIFLTTCPITISNTTCLVYSFTIILFKISILFVWLWLYICDVHYILVCFALCHICIWELVLLFECSFQVFELVNAFIVSQNLLTLWTDRMLYIFIHKITFIHRPVILFKFVAYMSFSFPLNFGAVIQQVVHSVAPAVAWAFWRFCYFKTVQICLRFALSFVKFDVSLISVVGLHLMSRKISYVFTPF